ncbi:hypothetical protein INT47_003635 [Mucor saturninus]|uniref:Sorting nexin MVP1 n=1 Tax=Mucor saturninus TaxID=64648 RepID=A0A8H7V7X8_9FUNG|nr:hypothetical protein INT47_003635 [Mucor saturninus]
MQTSFDNVLSPDFSEPLQYFDASPPLSRTTPPIYADDPWNSSSFEDAEPEMPHYFVANDSEQHKTLFGSNLTAANVLLGVDIPDTYNDIYSKSNPQEEKIDVKSLELILVQLSGLPLHLRQQVMRLVTAPEEDMVTRNEFNAFLALIACAQKNMEISLETIYHHRNDLPIPTLTHLETFNVREMLQPPAMKQDTTENNEVTAPVLRHNEEQEAMNQWFRDLDHITVSRTSEKEGFLFKHVNYEVESEKLGSKVLRRFSDFYWLWEVLLKRYQFRILPNLPPKKLGGRDDVFEERRRKGLVRFINAVIRHPVLGKDDVVVAFLSHPSEMSSWRRAKQPPLDEEFVQTSHNIAHLERLVPMDLDDRISRIKKRLAVSIQQYEHMCFIMNQMNRLKKALGTDYIRYSVTLNSVGELDKHCWVPGCQGCPQVVRGYGSLAKSLHQAGVILNKQAIATGDSIVESLKRQRDVLESFKELLDRRERNSPIPNEVLARQIARCNKRAVTQVEGLTLSQQRDIFIKYCFIAELSYLHKQQASVAVMYNTYVRDEVRYARQWSEHWKNLEVFTSEMPNTPHEFL